MMQLQERPIHGKDHASMMTIDEYFEAVKAALPGERWKVAASLKRRLSNDERVLASAWVGDFISAMEEQIIFEPPDDIKR